jgi:glutamine synthetase
MTEARKKANALTDVKKQAVDYCEKVKEAHFETIRYHVDKLELLVDDESWPLPKYRELLFTK